MVEFERILKDRGYRLTNQRRIIVRELEGERHLSAEEIYDRVKGEHPDLGLSTVYRTLDLLTELDIVRKDDFGEGYSRYELTTERVHHNAICSECGAVNEYNEELMEYLALQVERETGFVTDWHEITLHGRCRVSGGSSPSGLKVLALLLVPASNDLATSVALVEHLPRATGSWMSPLTPHLTASAMRTMKTTGKQRP